MSNKTLNFTKLVIPVVLLLLICSCKPRVRSLAPENPLDIDPAQFDSCIVFSGWVITKDKEPIENAEVQVKKKRILTNKEGYFKIVIVKDSIDSLPRYVLNIRKKGYGLISDISFAGISNKLYTMKKATIANIDPANINTVVDNTVFSTFPNCSGTLRSLIDWDAYPDLRFPENVSGKVRLAMEASETRNSCNPGVTVVIPANAIADGNGNSPRDMVTVSLATVDIFDENSMPGDNTVMAEGRPMYMETYGAMNIDVYAGDTTFQLKKGEYAKIIIPVNPDQLKGKGILPARMPLLLYDEEKGVWKVEGNARLNNNGDAYIAKIDHFSSYNMDLYKEDPACIKLDANNIAGPFYVEVDYISATGDIVSRRKMFIENKSDDKIHALYNLPPNTDVGITIGRKYGEIYHPLYVMETNTGDPIPEEERPCPELPYNSCGDAVIVIG
ncbi:MAG: carboxypeptidase-like regulatory domain-containing protein, partial [Bacteroidales bacterium]